jgi:hypothetical protein
MQIDAYIVLSCRQHTPLTHRCFDANMPSPPSHLWSCAWSRGPPPKPPHHARSALPEGLPARPTAPLTCVQRASQARQVKSREGAHCGVFSCCSDMYLETIVCLCTPKKSLSSSLMGGTIQFHFHWGRFLLRRSGSPDLIGSKCALRLRQIWQRRRQSSNAHPHRRMHRRHGGELC